MKKFWFLLTIALAGCYVVPTGGYTSYTPVYQPAPVYVEPAPVYAAPIYPIYPAPAASFGFWYQDRCCYHNRNGRWH